MTSVPSVEEIRARQGQPVSPLSVRDREEALRKATEETTSLREEVQRLRNVEQSRPSRSKLFTDLMSIFEKYHVEPIEELIKLATEGKLTPEQRARVWSELAAYKHPKLKSVEMTGSVDMNFTIVVRKFGESLYDGSSRELTEGGGVLRTVSKKSLIVESEVEEAVGSEDVTSIEESFRGSGLTQEDSQGGEEGDSSTEDESP